MIDEPGLRSAMFKNCCEVFRETSSGPIAVLPSCGWSADIAASFPPIKGRVVAKIPSLISGSKGAFPVAPLPIKNGSKSADICRSSRGTARLRNEIALDCFLRQNWVVPTIGLEPTSGDRPRRRRGSDRNRRTGRERAGKEGQGAEAEAQGRGGGEPREEARRGQGEERENIHR